MTALYRTGLAALALFWVAVIYGAVKLIEWGASL
jgi:hypothetical protein